MSIRTYSKAKDGKKALSAHFKVGEFGCAGTDKVLIDSALSCSESVTAKARVMMNEESGLLAQTV